MNTYISSLCFTLSATLLSQTQRDRKKIEERVRLLTALDLDTIVEHLSIYACGFITDLKKLRSLSLSAAVSAFHRQPSSQARS